MYQLRYGINYSDKTDRKDNFYLNALPLSVSGRADVDDFENLSYITFFCHVNPKVLKDRTENKNLGFAFWINRISKDKNLTLLHSHDRKHKKHTKVIIYKSTYPEFELNKAYLKALKHISENPLKHDVLNEMIDVDFSFSYKNKENKFNAYEEKYKSFNYPIYKKIIFLPTEKTKYNSLYFSRSHFCQKEVFVKEINRHGKLVKRGKLIRKLGNLMPFNFNRNDMNKDVRLNLEFYDRTLNLKDFYKLNDEEFENLLQKILEDMISQEITTTSLIQFIQMYKLNAKKHVKFDFHVF
jgi:hypothetical protein